MDGFINWGLRFVTGRVDSFFLFKFPVLALFFDSKCFLFRFLDVSLLIPKLTVAKSLSLFEEFLSLALKKQKSGLLFSFSQLAKALGTKVKELNRRSRVGWGW
jgi:hypothetical protein